MARTKVIDVASRIGDSSGKMTSTFVKGQLNEESKCSELYLTQLKFRYDVTKNVEMRLPHEGEVIDNLPL